MKCLSPKKTPSSRKSETSRKAGVPSPTSPSSARAPRSSRTSGASSAPIAPSGAAPSEPDSRVGLVVKSFKLLPLFTTGFFEGGFLLPENLQGPHAEVFIEGQLPWETLLSEVDPDSPLSFSSVPRTVSLERGNTEAPNLRGVDPRSGVSRRMNARKVWFGEVLPEGRDLLEGDETLCGFPIHSWQVRLPRPVTPTAAPPATQASQPAPSPRALALAGKITAKKARAMSRAAQ